MSEQRRVGSRLRVIAGEDAEHDLKTGTLWVRDGLLWKVIGIEEAVAESGKKAGISWMILEAVDAAPRRQKKGLLN